MTWSRQSGDGTCKGPVASSVIPAPSPVVPAEAGIQAPPASNAAHTPAAMHPRLRGDDGDGVETAGDDGGNTGAGDLGCIAGLFHGPAPRSPRTANGRYEYVCRKVAVDGRTPTIAHGSQFSEGSPHATET